MTLSEVDWVTLNDIGMVTVGMQAKEAVECGQVAGKGHQLQYAGCDQHHDQEFTNWIKLS